jgi:hypothetical protein
MGFVPEKGDAVRGVVIGGLAIGGEAPGGRDAREEEREELNGRTLAVSGLLLTSEGKRCQFSSSDEGVVSVSRFSGMGRRWWRGCIDW